jgi:hypothetical protein
LGPPLVDENLHENNDIEVDAYDNHPMVHAVVSETSLDDIRTEGISLVAGLRANSSIPYGVIPSIVKKTRLIATHLPYDLLSSTYRHIPNLITK